MRLIVLTVLFVPCFSLHTGFSNETIRFMARYDPTPLTFSEVKDMAGSKIADFCKDYITFFRTLTPNEKNKRNEPQNDELMAPCEHHCVLCVINSDLSDLDDKITGSLNFG